MDQHARQSGSRVSLPQSNSDESMTHSFKGTTQLLRAGVLLFALLVIGSYIFHWHWTGFDNNTLWQWLKLLLVPLAAALVPFWLSTHSRWQARWNSFLVGFFALLVILLVATYVFDWKWTGFRGTTLWDWLNLLLLPLVLTSLMIWVSMKPRWQPRWTLPAAMLLGLFLLLVLCGYAFHWRWTGFYGNTLWDWLNLLVLPFALPAMILWLSTQQEQVNSDQTKAQDHVTSPASLQSVAIDREVADQKYAESYIHDGETVYRIPRIDVPFIEREESDNAEETVFLHPEVPLAQQGEQGIEGL